MRKFYLFVLLSTYTAFTALGREYNETQSAVEGIEYTGRITNADVKIVFPKVLFSNMNSNIQIHISENAKGILAKNDNKLMFVVNDQNTLVNFNEAGIGSFEHKFNSGETIQIYFEDFSYSAAPNIPSIAWILTPISLIIFMIGYRLVKTTITLPRYFETKTSNSIYTEGEQKTVKTRTVKEMTEEVFS